MNKRVILSAMLCGLLMVLSSNNAIAEKKSSDKARTSVYLVSAQATYEGCQNETVTTDHVGSIRIRRNSVVLRLNDMPILRGRVKLYHQTTLFGAQLDGLSLERFTVDTSDIRNTAERYQGIPSEISAGIEIERIQGAQNICTDSGRLDLILGKRGSR